MTPRVLELLGPSTGGIRRHVDYLADQLRDSGWSVETAGPAGVLDGLTHEVTVPNGVNPLSTWRARKMLVEAAAGHDLIHAHGLKVGWLASTLSPRPPLVVSVHNLVLDEVAGRATPLLRRLEGRLPGRVDATIAISDEVARRFDDLPGRDRMHVIPPAGPPPNPTRSPEEVRRELDIAPDDDLVVTAARLTPQKDLDLLVDAAALVRQERPRLRWVIFGEGPDRAALETAISRRDLTGTVILAGRRPDVDSELHAADAVAVTSRWESGPLVVLEAVALGRPVVSTRVGLAPDVLAGGHGRLVDVGDPRAFADALVATLRDPTPDHGRMPGSSEQLAPPALAARVEAVYRSLLRAP